MLSARVESQESFSLSDMIQAIVGSEKGRKCDKVGTNKGRHRKM